MVVINKTKRIAVTLLCIAFALSFLTGCLRSIKDTSVSDIRVSLSRGQSSESLDTLIPGEKYLLSVKVYDSGSGTAKEIGNVALKDLTFSSSNNSCIISVDEFWNTATVLATNDTWRFADGSSYELTVKTAVGASYEKNFTWKVDWKSVKTLNFSGKNGNNGTDGRNGIPGLAGTIQDPEGKKGGDGGNATSGNSGIDGVSLSLEIAFYIVGGEKMLVVHDMATNRLYLFMRQKISVFSNGGNGGDGGDGGHGGLGGKGYNGALGGDQGFDGSPGNGGKGGNGGDFVIYVPMGFPLDQYFLFRNDGGLGGKMGSSLNPKWGLSRTGCDGLNGVSGLFTLVVCESLSTMFGTVKDALFSSNKLSANAN